MVKVASFVACVASLLLAACAAPPAEWAATTAPTPVSPPASAPAPQADAPPPVAPMAPALVSRIEAPRPTSARPPAARRTVRELEFRFPPGKTRLPAEEDARFAAFVSQMRNAGPLRSIAIEGRADEAGSDKSRLALATRRAESLKMLLAMHGIDLRVVSVSASLQRTWQAPDICKSAAGRKKNADCVNPGSAATVRVETGA